MDTQISSLNNLPRLLPGPQLLHQLIKWDEHQDACAIDFASHDKREKYRYQDVQACVTSLVSRIQSALRSHQISQEQHIVPIFLPQSPGLYISQLAILQSGGAFCPINLDAPKDRIKFVVSDISASIIITTPELQESVSWEDGPIIILIDEFLAIPTELSEICESREPTNNDLAYVMYTSGSSGTPKGVAVSHLAASQSLLAHEGLIPKFERFLQFAAPSFDVSIFEIFFPLTRGQTLVGCDRSQLLNNLPGMINLLEIDAVELTPTVVGALLQKRAHVPKLKLLMTIGEMLTRPIVEEFGGSDTKQSLLYGMYGPTEAAIHCTSHPKMRADARPSNIGVPFETVSVFIAEAASNPETDQNLRFIPKGELGELVLGGPQLAKGYLNREEQNKAAFVTMEDKQYYRTGDKGRILEDGSIEIHGRISGGQIKLRGQRVELGEIEDAVYKHPGIKTVVAVVHGGVLILFALTDDSVMSADQVMNTCSQWLPSFMVPSEIVLLQEFPYLPSGKVDKRKLETDFRKNREEEENLTNLGKIEVTVRKVLHDILGSFPSNIRLAAAGLDSLVSIKVSRELRSRGFDITTLETLQAETVGSLVKICENCSATSASTTIAVSAASSDLHSMFNGHANDIEASYPCTPLQNAMLAETAIDKRAYWNWIVLNLPGLTDVEYLRAKLHDLTNHNSILRTGFADSSDSSGYIQFIWKTFPSSHIEIVDAFTQDSEISKKMSLHHPLHFEILATESCLNLSIHIHHAVYDTWSLDLLLDDLDCLLQNETPVSRPPFSEFVSNLSGKAFLAPQASKEYWKDHMLDLEIRHLPNFHPKKVAQAGLAVAHHSTQISTKGIELTAKRMASSPQAVFQAAYALILASYLGSSDVCFGSVFSGRTLPVVGIEDIIGPCLATLPIRIDTSMATTLQDLVEELNNITRKHLEHSTLPLRDIKSANGFEPRQQLFDTLLIWQQTLHTYDHSRKNVLLVDQVDQLEFNLTLEITPTSNTIHFKANYQQSMLPEYQINMLLRQLEETTKVIIEHSESSPNNVFRECNIETLSIGNPKPDLALGPETLSSPVERIAKEDPNRPAIAFANNISGKNSDIQYMSYSAMNSRANQFAHYIAGHCIFPDDIICICLEKSPEFYASILATIKLGAGYLPIIPDIPQSRLQHILSEAKVKTLIGHSSSRPLLETLKEQNIIYIDEIDLAQQPEENLVSIFNPDQISYCVFTSGSTGTPKGVLVTQGNLLSNLDVLLEIYPATKDSKLLQSCSQAFDVSVFEIFFTWRIGGCLCSAVKDVLFQNIELAIRIMGVTHLSLTPTVAAIVDPQNVPKVEFLVTAGEAVTQKVFNTWADRGLYQGYGPSETTNICTVKPRVTLADRIDNIGPPFRNTSVFVLCRDAEFSLVPRGGEGEFCFGGSQVFRGYMNQAQEYGKTIDHPMYGRLYKSGDFGRLMPDGSLVFTGRKDDQVKIRGQRVELGEVNNVVISSPEVEDCLTMVINHKNSLRLVCFFTPSPNTFEDLLPISVDPVIIRKIYQSLDSKLPSYMVPSNLLPVSCLPSTPQGKIDKRRLLKLYESLELEYLDSTTRALKSSKEHQWTELQLAIRSILAEISQTSDGDIGPDTSFFTLGIDSISAIKLSKKLNQVVKRHITISEILRHTSVFGLAEHLSKCQDIDEDDTSSAHTNFDLPEDFVKSTVSKFSEVGRIVEKVTPCTPLQAAMLSAAESSSGASYSNHTMFNVYGDIERFRDCWRRMVQRHEILRTCFVNTDLQTSPYVQVVLENFEVKFSSLNSRNMDGAILETEVHLTDNKTNPPYSLNFIYSDREQRFLISMHHALYDGVALSVLYDEVEKLYHGLSLPSPVSFTPFLKHMGSTNFESSDQFWQSTLQGYSPNRFKMLSYKPHGVQMNRTQVQQLVPKISLCEIENKAKKYSTTLLAVFHTVWAATMSQLFKTTDVCFGNVVSGRTAPVDSIERLVAPCFNTVPTRLADLQRYTYVEAFRKLQNLNADSLPFQFTPLRRLQSKFSLDGERLFDTLFILQQPSKELDSLIWSIAEDNGAMDFPLVCEITPQPGKDILTIAFHSSTSILSEDDGYNIMKKFESILEVALENPRRQIISSSARAQIISVNEARNKERHDDPTENGPGKAMSKLELEIQDVIAEFTDIPLEKIGRETTIFRVGLDSISTVQVASRLRAQGHQILASDVLEHPTISRLASYLEQNEDHKKDESNSFDFVTFDRKYRETICSNNEFLHDNVEAIRPCTAVQHGMLAQSLHSDGHEYVNSISLQVFPEYSLDRIKNTWTEVCNAHEMLRTAFVQTQDSDHPFVMVTFTNKSFSLPWFAVGEETPSKNIDRLNHPWDIIVDQKGVKTLLLLTAHHALYDAQSMQMIFSDFTNLFNSQTMINRPSINTLLSSILQASKGDQEGKSAFWKQPENRIVINKFPDLTPLRVTTSSNAVREVKSQATLRGLEDRCREIGVTVQSAGQATWARLLMAYTGENINTFGVTLSGRSVCDDADIVAFPTIVTLPVSCNVMDSNRELLCRTMRYNAQLHKQQFTPLTSIQKWSEYPERRMFDTLFAYQKLPDNEDGSKPPWDVVNEKATVDYVISLELQPSPSGEVIIRLSFKEDIVPVAHAEIMVKQFDILLLDTINNPSHPCNVAPNIGTDLLSITPPQDPVLPDSVALLHQYVERGAKIWPDKVALEFATCLEPNNYQSKKWTYQELDKEANRVAQMLYKRAITPGEIIAICFDKCAEASFAIIGIMKAGCGYVALDPTAPAARLKFIVEDSAAKLIITAGNPGQTLRTFVDGEMIDLTDPDVLREFKGEMLQLSREIIPQDISYCLYTSGTTGTPKGCLLTHENAIQAMLAFQRLFAGHWTPDSKWLQFASFHFDVSVLEQFWSWSVGICVASAPRDLIFEDIPGAIRQLGITHIDLTPSLARLLHPDDVPSLCKGVFITGGEQLKQEILDVWGEHACIYNGYGPTEATIGVTMYPRVPKNGKPSNIGPQFDNVGSFVLKPGTELPVLRGGIGELCVSGKLVGKGYLNRPELTAERFPILTNFKERVYRTGDLVRILHDGTFLFLGRADDQVKLRGQRLELSEINEVIKKSRSDLEEVVTLVLKHKAQAKEQLVTFFVGSGRDESDSSAITPFIKDACVLRLPGYMVPTHFIPIKSFPLNANNKADSKQLAAMFSNLSVESFEKLSCVEQNHAEWTEAEKVVVKTIIDAFPVEVTALTRSSNIFQLGIDSITMVTFSHLLRTCGYKSATNAVVRNNPMIGNLVEALLVAKPDENKENSYVVAAKQNIAGFSQQHTMTICQELGVSIDQIECIAPCTPVQEGMIFRFLESDGRLYFNKLQYALDARVHPKVLTAAWDRVVSRLQILRTSFVSTNDGFAQVVLESVEPTQMRASKNSNEQRDVLKKPWYFEFTDPAAPKTLTLNIFHGLYDGNSLVLILNLLSDEFHKVQNIQYGPHFHSSLPHGPLRVVPGAENFWKSHLKTWSPHSLSHAHFDEGDFTRSRFLKVPNFEDARKALSVAPQAIIQAAWMAALQMVIPKNLTTIGVVTSGRAIDFGHINKVAGPLFNTVPFHLPIEDGSQVSAIIKECHNINMKMQDFQHTPLKDIKKWVSHRTSGSLFDTLFVFQRPDSKEERFLNGIGRKVQGGEINADYPLALEATLSHDNTRLVLEVVARSSAVTPIMVGIMLDDMIDTVHTILRGGSKDHEIIRLPSIPQSEALGWPPAFDSSYRSNILTTVLTEQQRDLVCSEIAILAQAEMIHQDEPRSIFELGLDSIDVIKLSSRLRKSGIGMSVSEIIKCQTIANIFENATHSKAKALDSRNLENLKMMSSSIARCLKNELPAKWERVYPATPLQESLFKEMVESNFERYFTLQVFQLSELTHDQILMRAVDHVIERSPILRTNFLKVQDPHIPVNYAQVVHRNWLKVSEIKPVVGDASSSLKMFLQEVKAAIREWASTGQGLFGATMAHFGERKFLVTGISHALYDGASLPMIHRDIHKAYFGHDIPQRPDYVYNIAEIFYSIRDEANDFWKATLWKSPPSVVPKQDLSPTQEYTFRQEKRSVFSLRTVKDLCRSSNITLQTLGQTCWALVLADIMGQLDVVFGTVLACRDTDEAGEVNFPLFNTVAVRAVLRGSLDQMLRDMQEKSGTTRQFQHFPLRKAQAYALGSRENLTKDTALFDTLFTYQGVKSEVELSSLYSSIGGSSETEFAICVEMEIDDKFDRLLWTVACKSTARTHTQTTDILENLDMILRRIMENKQEHTITIHSDGLSICGLPKFQSLDIPREQNHFEVVPMHKNWSETELKLRESISLISGLSEGEINRNATIFQLGLDSITILKLPALLKKSNIHLSASDIMKHLTIRDIATHTSGMQEVQQDTDLDVSDMPMKSMPLIKQFDMRRLQTSGGKIEAVMPATAGQKYMIRHWRNSKGSLFFPTFKFKFSKRVNAENLDYAWYNLQRNQYMLRTGFLESKTDSTITQVIFQHPTTKVWYEKEPQDWLEYSDIGDIEAPPVRLVVTNLSASNNQDCELHLRIHHALYDGISISLLFRGLLAWYEEENHLNKFLLVSECEWNSYMTTVIHEKNRSSVREKWIEYLGPAEDNIPMHTSPISNLIRRDPAVSESNLPKRVEVFVPGINAKLLKVLAQLEGVSVDHILIVLASGLFKRFNLESYPHNRDVCDKGPGDKIIGLYLANRFPFSKDLTGMPAPTLNLLPIKVQDMDEDSDSSFSSSVKSLQRALRMISEGGMATVDLDDIYSWTGVKVYGWINIVKDVDEDDGIFKKTEKAKEKGKMVDRATDAEMDKEQDWDLVNSVENPTGTFCFERDTQKYKQGGELFQPVLDTEGYARVVQPVGSNKLEKVKEFGAYVPSIDIEFRYHIDTQTLDVGIFGPEYMISLQEAEEWIANLVEQV